MQIKFLDAGINQLGKANFFKNHAQKCLDNAAYAGAAVTLTSVAKDVYAYTLRTQKDLKNKEMPEKDRKYVAAMDATTGVVTTFAQCASAFLIAKLEKPLCDRLFKGIDQKGKLFKCASEGLKAFLPLAVTLLVVKRTLVPLISTPIASVVEKHMKPSKAAAKYDDYVLYFGQRVQGDKEKKSLIENK